MDTICVDLSELPGNPVGLTDLACNTLTLGTVDIPMTSAILADSCFTYTAGSTIGSADTLCVEIEDQFGNIDTAIYIIDVIEVPDTQTVDTILVSVLVNTTDTICVPLDQLGSAPVSFTNLNCDPTLDWGTFGTALPGDSCYTYVADGIPGSYDTICVVLEDGQGNLDTTIYLISVIDVNIDTVVTSLGVGDVVTVCLDTSFHDLVGNIISVTDLNCSTPAFGTPQIATPIDSCITYTSTSTLGSDTVCVVICDDQGQCDTTIYVFDIEPSTDTIEVPTEIGVPVEYCLDTLELPGDIVSVTIVTAPLEGTLAVNVGTSGQDTSCVTYITNGPLTTDTAVVVICDDLGNCDTTVLVYIPDCNAYDFFATDTVEVVSDICGGDGALCVPVSNADLVSSTVTIDGIVVPFGTCGTDSTSILVPTGIHTIVFTDDLSGCTDMVVVNVICPDAVIVYDTLQTNDTITNCVLANGLPGGPASIVSMTNVCPDDSDNGTVELPLAGGTCFDYISDGVAGVDTVCIEVCDALGNCDTTTYYVTILPRPDTVVISLAIGDLDSVHCIPVPELPGNVDDVFIGCANPDNVMFTTNAPDTCVTISIISVGTDETCIVICDDLGFCDTTYFVIEVTRPSCFTNGSE